MIELIFAITVIGLVMLSAPMLIDRSTKSTYVALQQESIAAAATQINMIMTAEWDAADTNFTLGTPILHTGSSAIPNCMTTKPVGVTGTYGRYCKDSTGSFLTATAPGSLGTEGTEGSVYDDIDDFNGQSYTVSIYNAESYATYQGDYLDTDINVTSRIYYGNDLPKKADGSPSAGGYDQNTTFANPFRTIITANSTNIKLIQVTLTSANAAEEVRDKNIVLTAFMCNIGAPKKEIRNRITP